MREHDVFEWFVVVANEIISADCKVQEQIDTNARGAVGTPLSLLAIPSSPIRMDVCSIKQIPSNAPFPLHSPHNVSSATVWDSCLSV